MIEINNRTKARINKKLVKTVAEKFAAKYKIKNKEVSIAFVSDSEIKKLNKQYRHKNEVTDVLSFDGEGDFFGEILIDYAQIKRQAKESSKEIDEELVFILVHGLLHLVGYDDEKEKGRVEMVRLGERFIKKIF